MAILPDPQLFSRTLRIKTAKGAGTAFLVEFVDGTYLVSAAHLLEGSECGDKIYVSRNKKWQFTELGEIGFCTLGHDIAAARVSIGGGGYPMERLRGGALVGMELCYLGFPLGFAQVGMPDDYAGFAAPLLKAGVFSGLVQLSGLPVQLIASYGNVGFSGGPVIGYDPDLKPSHKTLRVFGFVSGGYEDAALPLKRRTGSRGEKKVDDLMHVNPQSGFVRFVGVSRLKEIVSEIQLGTHTSSRHTC